MNCKICEQKNVSEVINLGSQPLANKYPKTKNDFKNEKFFPLILTLCNNCLNVRIKKLVDRKEMFEDYYYLSSINKSLVRHFEDLAKQIKESDFVLDIGSNDGILLKPLKELGVRALGIDPSINVGKIANESGLETLIGFFSNNVVKKILDEYGRPDTIVASSIFTHLEDPKEFAINIKELIKPEGIFILEVEYLTNFIKNTQFERFYFDRPFYYSVNSIKILFESVAMSLIDVEFIDIHGGSIRCYIKSTENKRCSENVKTIIQNEKKDLNFDQFKTFSIKIKKESEILKMNLENFKKMGKNVVGYGAPARVATITNYAKIDKNLIKFIVDDNKLKQERHSPGMHIPIISREKMIEENIDIIIVFAYEYFEDIRQLTKNLKSIYYKPIPFEKLI